MIQQNLSKIANIDVSVKYLNEASPPIFPSVIIMFTCIVLQITVGTGNCNHRHTEAANVVGLYKATCEQSKQLSKLLIVGVMITDIYTTIRKETRKER